MTSTLLFALIGAGALIFVGYIAFTAKMHKENLASEDSASVDVQTAEKMKEYQLIKESKKVKSLSEKNNLFRRAYANKYGENALAETNENQQEAALPLETVTYEENENLHIEQELDKLDNTFSDFETEWFQTQEPAGTQETSGIVFSEQENEEKVEKQLEDDYTEEEFFTVNVLHDTFLKMYKG